MKNFLQTYYKYIIILLVIIGGIFLYIKYTVNLDEAKKQNIILQKELIAKDTLQLLADGKYAKLINNFKSQSDLNKQLSDSNKLLSDTIKARNERILLISKSNITFKNQKGTVTPIIENTKDSTYTFSSYYPNQPDYFIKYDGLLNLKNKTVTDAWTFGNLDLNIIVTERKDGLWDSYIDGPKFLKVKSTQVNSLPVSQIVPKIDQPKTFVLYGGLGLRGNTDMNVSNKDLLIKGGLTIKNNFLIESDFGTDKKVGLGLMFKL